MKILIILSLCLFTLTACNKSGNSTVGKRFLGGVPPTKTSIVLLDKMFTTMADTILPSTVIEGPDKFVYKQLTNPAFGIAVMNDSGDFSYTPLLNYFGDDQFSYQVTVEGQFFERVAKINVLPVNDAARMLIEY